MKLKFFTLACLLALPVVALAANPQAQSPLVKARAAMAARHYAQAYQLFKPLAEQGNAEAASNLATLFTAGWGVPRNPHKAFKWALQAAKGGNRNAQFLLAKLYDSGSGTEQNPARAVHWYKQAGEQGLVSAQFEVAQHYLKGIGVEASASKAADWAEKAANNGWPRAQLYLGKAYRTGLGVDKDLLASFRWYQQAAHMGQREAQYRIGLAFSQGLGVGRDVYTSLRWFETAAKSGYPPALDALGQIYVHGIGTHSNLAKALDNLKAAAQADYAAAQVRLALLRMNSESSLYDPEQAYFWAGKAAAQGSAQGRYLLAICLEQGIGVPLDQERALDLLSLAAKQGLPVAEFQMGYLYQIGAAGLDRDLAKALAWYNKAAIDRSPQGAYQLGLAYRDGNDLGQDPKKAAFWLAKAVAGDYKPARRALGRLCVTFRHACNTEQTRLAAGEISVPPAAVHETPSLKHVDFLGADKADQ